MKMTTESLDNYEQQLMEEKVKKIKEIEDFYQNCSDALWAIRAKIILTGELPDDYIHFEDVITDETIKKICTELLGKETATIQKINYVKNIYFS